MTEFYSPDFDALSDILLPLGILSGPSELHGFLCGNLCGGASPELSAWLDKAKKLLDIQTEFAGESFVALERIYQQTVKSLSSGDYDWQLFLPDDDTDLDQRTEALAQWCNGFLIGFGSAGIDPDAEFTSDQAAALKDIAVIVQACCDDSTDLETQEGDYMELVEYVRVVAMNFYEDNQAENPVKH